MLSQYGGLLLRGQGKGGLHRVAWTKRNTRNNPWEETIRCVLRIHIMSSRKWYLYDKLSIPLTHIFFRLRPLLCVTCIVMCSLGARIKHSGNVPPPACYVIEWCVIMFTAAHKDVRLLHSPCLVVVGPLVGCETWPSIGWYHPFGWSPRKIAWGMARLLWNLDSRDRWECPLTVPLHSPNGRRMPVARAVQGGCERVYKYVGR